MANIRSRFRVVWFPLLLVAAAATFFIPGDYIGRGEINFIRAGILFLAAPVFTLVFGIATAIIGAFFFNDSADSVLLVFAILGYLWVVGKSCYYVKRYVEERAAEIQQQQTTKERQALCEAALHQFEQERAKCLEDHKELSSKFAQLVAQCGSQAVEMMRATEALKGVTFGTKDPNRIVANEVRQICAIVSQAAGETPAKIGRLCYAIYTVLQPGNAEEEVDEKVRNSIRWDYEQGKQPEVRRVLDERACELLYDYRDGKVTEPFILLSLAAYDTTKGTALAGKAAEIYWTLLTSVGTICQSSVAATIVISKYGEFLRPCMPANGRTSGDPATSSGDNPRSAGQYDNRCDKCRKYYPLLGVQPGASEEDLKQSYKILVAVWHPDRFEQDSHLREQTEGRFKEIQEAYNHIKEHRMRQAAASGA